MGVTVTMPEGRAILDGGSCAVLEKWQLLVQLRSPRLEKHVALQLWTRYSVSSMEVMVIRWKRRLP